MTGVEGLVQRWRKDAVLLRQYRNNQQAESLEDRAAELEALLHEEENALLSLAEAAGVTGYSTDHLGRLVRQGRLPNAGTKHRPRIRHGDLPRRPRRQPIAGASADLYDPTADARSLASRRKGAS